MHIPRGRFLSARRLLSRGLVAVVLLAGYMRTRATDEHDYAREAEERCRQARVAWLQAGAPGEASDTGQNLIETAIHADRPHLVEQVLAGRNVLKRMLPLPRGSKRVTLHVLHQFTAFNADLTEEMFPSYREDGWVARRLTEGNVEVWTAKHGWLYDRRGRLVHDATPPRGTGWGREWYGAFLPDGSWVTTDLDEMDGQLTFFSTSGQRLRSLACEQLAPRPANSGAKLLGWGRSDATGRGWVVNVGSEEGWATVWVGPDGPARVLEEGKRWSACYPRALGPRGTRWSMSVPDDMGHLGITRTEAGHGPSVGFPEYDRSLWFSKENSETVVHTIPSGNEVFGFWPGKSSFFVGAECVEVHDASGMRTRKVVIDALDHPLRVIDKTWLFDTNGDLTRWVRARRIGDAADGRAMLFRVTADSRIVTLDPDLRVRAIRRFAWKDGSTADAVALWDDLGMGLFIRHKHLVLAAWKS